MAEQIQDRVKSLIKDVPDFPKKGIIFKDITPVLEDGPTFKAMIQAFVDRYKDQKIDAFLGIESRGFLLAAPVAMALERPLVLLRKPNKLPRETLSQSYQLEYGEDRLEMHKDSLETGQRVVIFDDLLATGGTLSAACSLVEQAGATVVETALIIELGFLDGRSKLGERPCFSMLRY